MTATADRSGRLGALGIASIAPAAGWRVLAELLEAGLPQVGVLDLNLGQWLELFPAAAEAPFLAELVRETDADASTQVRDTKLLRELTALDSPRERLDFMERYLRGEIAQALRMDPSDIDPRQSLADMGFDSLLALEFKNRMERALGITLSATALLTHPTLESLAPLIAQRLGIDAQDAEPEHPAPEPAERVGAHGAPAAAAGEDVRERADERREAMRQRTQLRRERGHGVESESR
jgi:aryl carrier-like protein